MTFRNVGWNRNGTSAKLTTNSKKFVLREIFEKQADLNRKINT